MSDRPLSVAIVRARYNPFGGAERFVQRALAALGGHAELTVIARHWPGAEAGSGAAPLPVRFERVDPFHVGSVWRDWSFARGVRRLVARRHFDLVQSHERIAGLPVYRAGDGVHRVFLRQRLRALPWWRRAMVLANPHHAWVLHAERAMFRHPALRAVICNSVMVRDEIAAHFGVAPSRLHVVRNGIDLQRFRPAQPAERAAARAALGLADGEAAALFVGSGFERKGLAACLHALARLDASSRLRLFVVGADRRAGAWRRLARRLGVGARVSWLGPRHDVLPSLHAADLFVLPTLYDPFPNAALEALACGLPVVTSTASGAAEFIEAGRNGYVVDALDHAALARAMTAIEAADGQLRSAMQREAHASVQSLSLEHLGRELVALYRRLLAAR
ncbi:MAG: glycosyltransferase family 4 protein [Burkholderiales bacterium]|nr:glycosyltransferase family 4 protein [Burkholderiales bacterium]OJX07562.1 MAG: hypothetical protein BGO72_08975 [Burkholderiales bacterium 70-64]